MKKIAVAPGDGIGPEVMDAALEVFEAAGVPLTYERVEMGLDVWKRGVNAGITDHAREVVESTGILFKGPMATPKGSGVKSINVTARKTWNTFANKRVFRTLPGVPRSRHAPEVDITLIRENIEDTYGAIEHMQTHDVAQCRRLITRPGSEQLVRYAFEVASRKGARRVTCGHKANIMKLTDGLFLDVFREVASEYPHLQADDRIVDALAMELVMKPDDFDVVVLPNLQGDILSDLCAGLVGGLAYAPSANIGEHICIFEAVHGTAPDIAGQDRANPTALLLSGCIMLRHLGLVPWADRIESVLPIALREAYRPRDLATPPWPFSTKRFTKLVVDLIQQEPPILRRPALQPLQVAPRSEARMMASPRQPEHEETVGVDLFIDSDRTPDEVAAIVQKACKGALQVKMISNRGTQVWPTGSVFTDCVNHHRVRVEADGAVEPKEIFQLAGRISGQLRVCSLEALLRIDGVPAYSLAQGQ
ncbi:MAG: isocitrate dehydrogenase [Deltaproteobacteria bacterium]|nr:MAG: isocitrate dehydrogenase [Deltaproteobacteria bacterium]